jgi:ABC-type lipoprotein export system ATPase subunit
MGNSIALELINISHAYATESSSLQILSQINLQVERGQVICIVGASGSGKSTMLSIAGLLLKPSEGEIKIAGKSPHNKGNFRAKNVGFIYQNQFLLEDFTAQENVELPLLIQGADAKLTRAKSTELLAKMDLLKRANHMPRQLSGGEKQRVAVARAVICSPQLIIADEPTGSLNQAQGREVFGMLRDLTKDKSGCLLATHDMDLASLADKVYCIENGQLKG